eukprot:scaffold1169_cov120-Cylindrotheca_fusiformis.AAC.33
MTSLVGLHIVTLNEETFYYDGTLSLAKKGKDHVCNINKESDAAWWFLDSMLIFLLGCSYLGGKIDRSGLDLVDFFLTKEE